MNISNLLHLPFLLLLVWLAWRKWNVPNDGLWRAPFRLFKFVALVALLGLAGCASHEKLAVASGPVFPLNPDHWQASPSDLAAPDAGK